MWRAPTARAPSVCRGRRLASCGYRVGVFSSPWVTDFREQITVDGRMIPKQDFADCVEVFAKEPLTEFELITAVMYLYFYRSGVDYAVVECGMAAPGIAPMCWLTPQCAPLPRWRWTIRRFWVIR